MAPEGAFAPKVAVAAKQVVPAPAAVPPKPAAAPKGAVTPKGERRRYALVNAAAELLREGGFEAVRHRAVARRAGLPLASTTYYFSSLDDLIASAVAHIGMLEVAQLRASGGHAVASAAQRRHHGGPTGRLAGRQRIRNAPDRTADFALRAAHRLCPPARIARNPTPQPCVSESTRSPRSSKGRDARCARSSSRR